MSQFAVHADYGNFTTVDTIDAAIAWGRTQCYLAPKREADIRKQLEEGGTRVMWTYGFASVAISKKV